MGCCQPVNSAQPGKYLGSGRKSRFKKSFMISPGDFVAINTDPIQSTYTFQGMLGSGTFSEVRKVYHHPTGTYRAAKSIPLSASSTPKVEKLLKEVSILKRLDHPGIIKVYEVFQNPTHIYIVTELCTGGELFDRIKDLKKFSENQAAHCMLEIVSALMHCHQLDIVHRDLKPENVMYSSREEDSVLKVIDFGTSQLYNKHHKMKKIIGTYVYMAPEVISGEYDEKCDVWSLGIMLYIMLCGIPPFCGRNDQEVVSRIQNAPLSFSHSNWNNISEEAKALVMNMLKKNPGQRLSIEEVFNDPWIQARGHNRVPDIEIESESLKLLSSFKTQSILQKAVCSYIVSQMLDSEYFNSLREIFTEIDKNGDGLLSVQEIQDAANKVSLSINVLDIIKECDSDKNGFINYTEFLTATVDRSKAFSRARIREVFNIFDKDHDGNINLDELRMALGGDHNNESALLKIIQEADTNNDGQIDFDEFLTHVGKFS